ncbi:hypothetical protein ABO04_05120 [Nitrosomonas sp. HPC101]|uniref:HipA domain-containing protein n=1 Tax=Nitrosomonas sp. HPC101 TaxID=1658667 RepID=UPI0013695020|nr:HipA domain-containing protein [Nitrosomonas sp. HPC101]MXS85315.1 hypothetical protein [Nitrosomonas sp. HPC101]
MMQRIRPLVQTDIIDVSGWEADAEFAIFPQGARAKEAVFAPSQPHEKFIVPNKRYLFKRSKRSYPDQFWGEVIAYRIGCLLGVSVPPAFVATNTKSGHCAALIEWFYIDGKEQFILGGDLVRNIQTGFDRKYGQQHNIVDIVLLMRIFSRSGLLKSGWRQWWVDALLFDALIGNTDRHQDNWGVIFEQDSITLSPLFDNGTSLGHERFPDLVRNWSAANFNRYILKGTHHVKWSLTDQPLISGHLQLLERALKEWPETKELTGSRLNFSNAELTGSIYDLQLLDAPLPLTRERMLFILKLLTRRHQLLKSLFE